MLPDDFWPAFACGPSEPWVPVLRGLVVDWQNTTLDPNKPAITATRHLRFIPYDEHFRVLGRQREAYRMYKFGAPGRRLPAMPKRKINVL